MLRHSLSLASWLCLSGVALGMPPVPPEIAGLYEDRVDSLVSDEFDGPSLDLNKWDYRTESASANWLQSNVSIDDNGSDKYLNLYGESNRQADASGVITGTGSSSGVYSRNAIGFGFYTTRWRVAGISPDHKSSWHPAIWKANVKPIPGWPRDGLPIDQIEIDFIEFNQNRTQNIQWHSQAIEWTRDSQGSSTRTNLQNSRWSRDFQDTFWNEHGLEYHPDYIQLWDYDLTTERWWPRGDRITISDAETSEPALNINRDSAHPGYWILSNYDFFDRTNDLWIPFHGRPIMDTDNFLLSDSALQIDHFRFYPLHEPMKADFNNDGVVDAADYTIWRDTLGMTGDGLLADARGAGGIPDGVINELDYEFWKASFGETADIENALSAVPEPEGVLLLTAACIAMRLGTRIAPR